MKIRITGTLEEVEEMEEALKKMPFIRSISSLYKNRGINNEYRLYIETCDLKEAFQPEEEEEGSLPGKPA